MLYTTMKALFIGESYTCCHNENMKLSAVFSSLIMIG